MGSLLTTPWLPVRFKDGSTGKLAPVNLADENVVDIAATRADLQGAAWQFCWDCCNAASRRKTAPAGRISGLMDCMPMRSIRH